ncbi:hypothetical protein FISHEDRAFT_44066, partial [Fistulina hepatica ATCC 64428]
RFYSTPGPSVDSTRSSRSDDTLAAATPKKTKVALHPAPMKPSRETTGKPKKAVQSTKKLAGSSITPPAAHVPARPTPEDDAALHMKVSTSTEEDMKDAYRHGILRPPPEGAGVLKRSLHTLIELGKFYYRGIKMVAVTNRREAKAILQRVSDGGSAFTRAETRFLWTQESDMSRVIPFTIIALTIEELIPLIVLFAPGMLPSTCILPSQRKRIDTKAEAEAILAWKNGYRVFKHLKQASLSSRLVSLEEVLGLGGAAKYLVKLLRLSDRPLDFWRIFQLRDHLQHLAMDDQLLLNEGILTKKTLTTTEVDAALEERGLYVIIQHLKFS